LVIEKRIEILVGVKRETARGTLVTVVAVAVLAVGLTGLMLELLDIWNRRPSHSWWWREMTLDSASPRGS